MTGRRLQNCAISTLRDARVCRAGELLRPSEEGMSMQKKAAVATLAALLVAVPALAEPAIFTWTGYGLNVPGSGKCPTYKMTIDVTVVGTDVKGLFQQEGRQQRHFEATLGADKKFKT